MGGTIDNFVDIKPHRRKFKSTGSKEANFIAYCEQFYFLNKGGFPTPEQAAIALRYSVTEINLFLQNLNVQDALERRGLPWRSAGAQSGLLTPTQLAAANLIMNFADERPIAQKLDSIGVQPAQFYAWQQDDKFRAYLSKLADNNLEFVRPEAIAEFTKLVRQGDFRALQYYFEVTGEFKGQATQNVQAMLQMVIEAVQRHVKEPTVLAAIASDLLGAVPGVANNVTVEVPSETGRQNVLTGGSR